MQLEEQEQLEITLGRVTISNNKSPQGMGTKNAEKAQRLEELEKIVQHALFREYPDVLPGNLR